MADCDRCVFLAIDISGTARVDRDSFKRLLLGWAALEDEPISGYFCYKRQAHLTLRHLKHDSSCVLYRYGSSDLSPREYDEIAAVKEEKARDQVDAGFRAKVEESSRRNTSYAIAALALAVVGILLTISLYLLAR